LSEQLNDSWLDLERLAKYASLSKNSLRKHIKYSGLPAYRVGGKLLIKQLDFDNWVRERPVKALDIKAIAKKALERHRSKQASSSTMH